MATLNSWFKKKHELRDDPTSAAIRVLMKRGIEHKRALSIALEQKRVRDHLQKESKSSTVNLRSGKENSTEPEGSGPPDQDSKG